ncbi:MAG: patatin-like phospholipase family protein, partial [Gammaproteobacteria bacterium]
AVPLAAAPMDPQLRDSLEAALRAAEPGDESERPFSLVIKGGISLGSYEAGVNWALLRLLRDLGQAARTGTDLRPQLLAAAGASAGAINGFLAGLMWCTESAGDDDPAGGAADTLAANLIRDTWRRVDVDTLLRHGAATEGCPDERDPAACAEDKAAFSRAVLRDVQRNVGDEIRRRSFREGCRVAFGAALTRSRPVTAANAGVHVPQQRLVLPLLLEADDSGLAVRNLELPAPNFATDDPAELAARPFLSSVIYLDAGDGGTTTSVLGTALPLADVFQAIKASASFPVAFSPLKLDYCIYQPRPLTRAVEMAYPGMDVRRPTPACPPNYRRLSSFFVDGGVFDNDPLELVRYLSETEARTRGMDPVDVQYVKVDPGRRRPPAGYFEFRISPWAQPGDSIEVTLWASDPRPADDASRAVVEGSHIERIRVIRCLAEPLEQDGERRWLAQEFPDVALVETGVNTRLFIGAIHTRDAADAPWQPGTGPVIPVAEGDRLLVHAARESEKPTCDTDVDRDQLEFSRRRSIGIVEEVPPGLVTQLEFLGGSVSSARNLRLHNELLATNWHDGVYADPPSGVRSRPLFQPARLTPLVGDYLFGFGAFLDERFRDFDYYAGVYDTVYGTAELICLAESGLTPDAAACRGEAAGALYRQLCAPGGDRQTARERCRREHPVANAVIYQLVLLETCGVEAAMQPLSHGCALAPEWQWVEALVAGTLNGAASRELLAVGSALVHSQQSETDDGLGGEPFVRFIRTLARAEADFRRNDSRVLDHMLARSDWHVRTWYYPLTETTIPRLLDLQQEDTDIRRAIGLAPAEASAGVTAGLAIGGLVSESLLEQPLGWQWDQTSVPRDVANRWIAAVAPSEFTIDARNGGAAFFWNPGWRISEHWAVDLRIGPYQSQDFGGETIEFAEATAFASRRTRDPLLSSFGIGPTWTYTWSEQDFGNDHTLGASAYVGLAADKVRITYGWRSFSRDDFAGDDLYWHLGVNDLPGLLYWGCRGWDEPPSVMAWLCGR